MKITFSPQAGLPGQPEATLVVSGDVLTVDGVVYDLSPVPEGGEAVPEGSDHPFIGTITRQDGVIHATVRVRLGDTAADHQPVDPARWQIEAGDGPVEIPALRKPQEAVVMGSSDGENWHQMEAEE